MRKLGKMKGDPVDWLRYAPLSRDNRIQRLQYALQFELRTHVHTSSTPNVEKCSAQLTLLHRSHCTALHFTASTHIHGSRMSSIPLVGRLHSHHSCTMLHSPHQGHFLSHLHRVTSCNTHSRSHTFASAQATMAAASSAPAIPPALTPTSSAATVHAFLVTLQQRKTTAELNGVFPREVVCRNQHSLDVEFGESSSSLSSLHPSHSIPPLVFCLTAAG